jgi:hypothetical protein
MNKPVFRLRAFISGGLLPATLLIASSGCSSDTPADDTALRQQAESPKVIKADDLPDNVPQWVKDQVRAGEQRQAGAGKPGPAAPPPAGAGKL